jgi:hypothetical protein
MNEIAAGDIYLADSSDLELFESNESGESECWRVAVSGEVKSQRG